MKKIVLFSSVIAAMLTVFTSCSKDPYSPPQPQPEKSAKEKYNEHFRTYIGGNVASNQDWGFGLASKATTRAEEEDTTHVVMAQEWNAEFDLPFMTTVQEYFPEGTKSKVEDWTSFEFLEKATFHNVRLIYTKITGTRILKTGRTPRPTAATLSGQAVPSVSVPNHSPSI